MHFSRPSLAASALMLGLSFAAPVLIFTGCAPTSTTTNVAGVSQAIADAQAIVSGVDQSWSALKLLYPQVVTPATDAQVRALLDSAPGILAQLSTAADAATNAGGLRGVESLVNQVLNIASATLSNVPGVPPNVLLDLQAASVLLPILEATAQTLVPAAPKVGSPPARFASSMTPDQARAVLRR
jgi:hypothetical protein